MPLVPLAPWLPGPVSYSRRALALGRLGHDDGSANDCRGLLLWCLFLKLIIYIISIFWGDTLWPFHFLWLFCKIDLLFVIRKILFAQFVTKTSKYVQILYTIWFLIDFFKILFDFLLFQQSYIVSGFNCAQCVTKSGHYNRYTIYD